jgi:SAM-dependent methyltransferase
MTDKITVDVDPDLHIITDEYSPEDWASETTSIGSSLYRGLMENGRRYQSLKSDEYCFPADERQFETYDAAHLAAIIGDSDEENMLFQAPLSPKNVLDIGTGKGSWAIDVADMFPNAAVRGVDLFPPPVSWMPPNCVLEVDDVLQEWTWREKFDLIHLRIMASAFTPAETEQLMKQVYDCLEPGGWIEQMEIHPTIYCDDDSIPHDNVLFDIGPRYRASPFPTPKGFVTVAVGQTSRTDLFSLDLMLPLINLGSLWTLSKQCGPRLKKPGLLMSTKRTSSGQSAHGQRTRP